MDRRELLWRMSSQQFAALDTQLYLDTHPYDTTAIQMFNQYRKSQMDLKRQYESLYGPLSSDAVIDVRNWKWVSDPWPWERSAN